MSFFRQPSHIKSVEECEEKFQRRAYGCLPKVSLIFNGKQVLWEVKKVLQSHFSDLYKRLNALTDQRERECYSPAELIMGGVVLFLLKAKSRNEMDQLYRSLEFSRNYRKIFKLRCPSMSAVEDFYRLLSVEEFDVLKAFFSTELIFLTKKKRTYIFSQTNCIFYTPSERFPKYLHFMQLSSIPTMLFEKNT